MPDIDLTPLLWFAVMLLPYLGGKGGDAND